MFEKNLEIELKKLQIEVEQYRRRRKKYIKEQEDAYDAFNKLQAKSSEIEEGIEKSIHIIEKRLANLNPNNKFKMRYLDNAKRILRNNDTAKALETIQDAEKKARRKYLNLDDNIEECTQKITKLELEIENIKSRLR